MAQVSNTLDPSMPGRSIATLTSAGVVASWLLRGTCVLQGEVADEMRVTLEIGPKGKKVVAVAPDWPGLARGAKTGEAAIERLRSYFPRYARVAKLAGMEAAFGATPAVEVVERYPGTGSTDVWGPSVA